MRRDKDNSDLNIDNDKELKKNSKKNTKKASDHSDAAVEQQNIESSNTKDQPAKLSETTLLKEDAADKATNELDEKVVKDDSAEEAVSENADNSVVDKVLDNMGETNYDDELSDINSDLAKQISTEMDNQALEQDKLKKKRRLFKIQSSVVLTVLCLVGFGFFFGFTKPGNSILMSMGVNIGGTIWTSMTNKFEEDPVVVKEDIDYLDEEDLQSTAPTVAPEKIVWPDHPGDGEHQEGVFNILLLGEEAIGMGDGRGHTDVMVIATLNTKNKTVKLTSLMRDMYVQIPGYKDNKLNVSYAEGGLDLLYETIATNFDIRLDGCVKVNFKNFEKIVDDLGGLELTLKQNEADYLNTTNYISKKQYRHVVAGKQLMNGNQVLGYARVRKTSTITGHTNDYGRTDRHRAVLNAMYEKCRSKSKAELLSLMFKFLPMITTDINSDCFESMLNSYLELGMNTEKIEQLRIPADNTFQDNLRIRGMSVLVPDLKANREILHDFIFGEDITTGGDAGSITKAPDATVTPTSTPASKK